MRNLRWLTNMLRVLIVSLLVLPSTGATASSGGCFEEEDLDEDTGLELYNKYVGKTRDLLANKNHDYDEAWRNMRVSSLTDIILMKLLRVKQIEDNDGKTFVSEGLDANYFDIINYAVFALIQLTEEHV